MEIQNEISELIECVNKVNNSRNKNLTNGKLFVNETCDKCGGYDIKCGRYASKPLWYGKD